MKGATLPHGPRFHEKDSAAVIWQGFSHRWLMANHRTNRIGDLVENVPTTASGSIGIRRSHSGASGLAPDTLSFQSYATRVKVDRVWFTSGVQSFDVTGTKGQVTQVTRHVTGTLPGLVGAGKRAFVLLQGFDLYANGSSSQLFELGIQTANLTVNNTTGAFAFDLLLSLGLDCQTPECSSGTGWDYHVRLGWQIAAGAPADLNVEVHPHTTTRAWDATTELPLITTPVSMHNTAAGGAYKVATPGVASILIRAESATGPGESVHMLDVEAGIQTHGTAWFYHDKTTREMRYDERPNFRGWRVGMATPQDFWVSPLGYVTIAAGAFVGAPMVTGVPDFAVSAGILTAAIATLQGIVGSGGSFALRNAGTYTITLGAAMIELGDGDADLTLDPFAGFFSWPGGDISASGGNALSSKTYDVGLRYLVEAANAGLSVATPAGVGLAQPARTDTKAG